MDKKEKSLFLEIMKALEVCTYRELKVVWYFIREMRW